MLVLWRWALALVFCCCAPYANAQDSGAGTAKATESRAGQPVRITGELSQIDLWPNVTILSDPSHSLTLSQVLARSAEFTAPVSPHANLGPRTDTVWLRIPFEISPQAKPRWYVSVSYVLVTEIQFFEVCGEKIIEHAQQGMGGAGGPEVGLTRLPGVPLLSAPGQRCELLVRARKLVQNALLMPISVMRFSQFVRYEGEEQLWQGLSLGVALCLLGYAVVQASLRRSALLVWFSVFTVAGIASKLSYFGIVPEHLWSNVVFPQSQLSLLGILVMASAGMVFSGLALDLAKNSPRTGQVLYGIAAGALAFGLAFILGLFSTSALAVLVRVIMPFALLFVVPVAIKRVFAGDRVAVLTLAGWLPHGAGLIVGALLHSGKIPWTWWTDHAMQIGFTLHLVTWALVMSLRMNQIRVDAMSHKIEKAVLLNAAQTDTLTGLLNRRGLTQAVQSNAEDAESDTRWTVFLTDLDGFKTVNDTLGHRAGDALLAQVAERLRTAVGPHDLVCRLGGDEFVVVSTALGDSAAASQLGRHLVDTCKTPFAVDGRSATVGMTAGFSVTVGQKPDLGQLLKRADAAMYRGKWAGKNQVIEFDAAFMSSSALPLVSSKSKLI